MLFLHGVFFRELKELRQMPCYLHFLPLVVGSLSAFYFLPFYFFTFKQACQFVKLGKLKHAA